jgi:3-methyladenine DNA glycosylase Tag
MQPDFKEIFDRITKTMDVHKFDWRKEHKFRHNVFREMSDEEILQKLFKTTMYQQAKSERLSRIMRARDKEIKRLFHGFDLRRVSELNEHELDEIIKELKNLGLGTLFINKKVKAMPHNASILLKIMAAEGSLKKFFEKEPDNMRLLLTNKESRYKLNEVGPPLCSDFMKCLGIDEFKSDIHTKRLFHTLGLIPKEDDAACRRMGFEFAKALGMNVTDLDSILWAFCADDKAEICIKRNPKCSACLLKTKKPLLCAGCN